MKTNFASWKSFFASTLILLVVCSCDRYINTDGGLLWEITRNGLKEPSYLFGTNHGMSGDFVDSIPGFWDAFNSVEQFVMESDFTKPKRLDSIKPVNIFLPKDTTYHDLLDDDELAVLDSILLIYSPYNSREMRLAPAKLLLELQIGMVKRESRKWAKENPYLRVVYFKRNIDSRLLKIARFRSYPIIELDSEEEMDKLGIRDWSILFSSDDLRVKAKEMVQSFKGIQEDSLMEIARNSMEAYYKQDLKLLHQWSTHPRILKDKMTKINHYVIAIERNIMWIDKILPAVNKKSSFIMVGAAHLPGKKGVINLLRKEGYTVQPIK